MTRLHYAATQDADLLYLVQAHIADPFFFLEHAGVKRIFLGSTDAQAYREKKVVGIEVVDVGPLAQQAALLPGERVGNLALLILEKYDVGIDTEVIVPAHFPVNLAEVLQSKSQRYLVVSDWCKERVIKSTEEINVIKENFQHTKKAYALFEQILRESTIDNDGLCIINDTQPFTSEFLKREVQKLLLDYDLVCPQGIIISSGLHAAMPHHSGTGSIKAGETIVVDIFPQSQTNHYFADMTRTYVKGEVKDEIKKMYEAVEEAQRASLAALLPGASTRSVYEISAAVIKDYGFDVGEVGYTHSLGHGLGVALHEAPNLGPCNDSELKPGMVVTIEPGLYYPEIGGVRIEDTVVITETGYENLTNFPQNPFIT